VCNQTSGPEQNSVNVAGYYIIRNFVEILGFHRGVVDVSVLPGYCDASLSDWAPITHCRETIPKKTLRNCISYVPYVSVYVTRIVKLREIALGIQLEITKKREAYIMPAKHILRKKN
jgi:hypothetical protein